MIRYFSFLVFLFVQLSFSFGQAEESVQLIVTGKNCENVDSIYLYEFDGIVFKAVQAAAPENGNFTFDMPVTGPRFYYVGNSGNNLRPLILGTEKEVKLVSDCNSFKNAIFTKSPLNKEYAEVKNTVRMHQQNLNRLANQYRRIQGKGDKIKQLDSQLKAIDEERLMYMDSLKKKNRYFASVAALNTYLSFQNNGAGFNNEIEYFANKYFQFADWKNENYNYLPWVYESLKSYTTTLSSVNLTEESQRDILDAVLKQIPEDSRTYKLAMGGVMSALLSKGQPNYTTYAKRFIEKYKSIDPISTAQVEKDLKKMAAFSIGGEAPDFEMANVDGEMVKLSDLRGKIVLVDFWASWCGPCRRENPQVVKLYEKYNEKGFDILSVSLDKNKDRWVNAIAKDNLKWNHHVSDLKGWSNEAAKLYGVRSIPETVLIDNEGKIIARKLRGESLEAKLKEIFGE